MPAQRMQMKAPQLIEAHVGLAPAAPPQSAQVLFWGRASSFLRAARCFLFSSMVTPLVSPARLALQHQGRLVHIAGQGFDLMSDSSDACLPAAWTWPPGPPASFPCCDHSNARGMLGTGFTIEQHGVLHQGRVGAHEDLLQA